MALLRPRAILGELSTTAIAAIITGVGVILLCLLISLVFLLVRAVRKHKKLLADLDERGVTIAQAHKSIEGDILVKPRSVIRRNTILPFNKDGWGALPSVETIQSAESSTVPAHYAPKKPTNEVKKSHRLSWPCSTRRLSGHTIQMKKIKGSRLSTVIEDPKPPSQGPVMSMPHLNGSRTSLGLSVDYDQHPTRQYSMSQQHPALRSYEQANHNGWPETRAVSGLSMHTDSNARLQRAKSVAEVQFNQPPRPQLRVRSISLSQIPGRVPDVILPPLPLDVRRSHNDAEGHNQLGRTPSKLSASSFGSADTTILASRPSPNSQQSAKPKPRKITKPNAKGSKFAGSRPFRDTLELRARVSDIRQPLQPTTSGFSVVTENFREGGYNNRGTLSAGSSTNSLSSSQMMHSVTLARLSSPADSPATVRSSTSTPKRKLITHVSSSGSPERHCPSTMTSRNMYGPVISPIRQHSQTSSRSSGGNPFQWDPTPLSPSGKPSALKGSPSARKGHQRKKSVRISLIPNYHDACSRTPSPSFIMDSRDDTIGSAQTDDVGEVNGLRLSGTRSLPAPPSPSAFSPELEPSATSIRASLTSTSPTLPLVGYDQNYAVSSTEPVLPPLSLTKQKRLSNGSCFSFSQFPTTPSIIEPEDIDFSQLDTAIPARTDSITSPWIPDTPLLQQYSFALQNNRERSPSPTSIIEIDEYDPERPSCICQTPTTTSTNPRLFQSAFATIPEESSISSNKTLDLKRAQGEDSPPVSPKTMSPPRFTLTDNAGIHVLMNSTVIPEEPDTINPAILTKDAFSILNSGSQSKLDSDVIFATSNSSRESVIVPATPESSRSMFEPLLNTPDLLGSNRACSVDSPKLAHLEGTSPSSLNHSLTLPNLSIPSSFMD